MTEAPTVDPSDEPRDLDAVLARMRALTERFYHGAVGVQVHAFVEFTGLLSKFVDVCSRAHAKGIDFTQANTHSGRTVPLAVHDVVYLAEKLDCIYGPALLMSQELRDAFIAELFKGRFRLVPAAAEPAAPRRPVQHPGEDAAPTAP